jgi:hypothetical protein
MPGKFRPGIVKRLKHGLNPMRSPLLSGGSSLAPIQYKMGNREQLGYGLVLHIFSLILHDPQQ